MIADVTAYTLVKFLHVTLAMVWVGGAVMLQLMGRTALASRLPGRLSEFTGELDGIGKKVFTPVPILVVLLGFYLVVEGDWDFGSAWISLGILGAIVSVATGAGVLGPQSAKAARLGGTGDSEAPGVRDTVARVLKVGLMDIGLLVFIVFLMVTKLGA